jgi:AraC-like DNA-binding protein
MRQATLEEFAAAPLGRFVAGTSFAHFCATPSLWGVILWGRPDEEEAFALGRSLVLELDARIRPHASLVDASGLEGGDPTAFRAAERYLRHNGPALAARVSRLALVRPSGMGGAIVAGAFEVLPRPYPVAVFGDVAAAFAWLAAEGSPELPADGAALVAAIRAAATGTPPLLGGLRALLDERHDLGVAQAARRLGLSQRTLQRRLGELGTTFQDELAAARVRHAKQLLLDGDAPLTRIAFDVGCSSLQHFSALFRERTGESPSAFRKRHRQ